MQFINKNIIRFLFIIPLFAGCKKDLVSTNVDPNNTSSVDPGLLFSGVLVSTTANQVSSSPGSYSMNMEPRTNYCHAFMQYGYISSWSGTNYLDVDGVASPYWTDFYSTVVKNLEYLLPVLKNRPDLVNTYSAAKIWHVYVFQKITDFYGDIPFTQAGHAYSQQIFAPEYDTQEVIFDSLISDLKTAVGLFDATAKSVQGDQFYGGTISQWEKLAYSLLLRIGMRLIKVDPHRQLRWRNRRWPGASCRATPICPYCIIMPLRPMALISISRTSISFCTRPW